METRQFYILRFILACTDLVLVNICFFLGFYFSDKYGVSIHKDFYNQHIFACNLLWVLSTGIFRLYSQCTLHKLDIVYKATWFSAGLHVVLFLAYLFLSNNTDFPGSFIVLFYGLMGFGFLLSRSTGASLQTLLTKNYDIRKAVAVLGMNHASLKLAAYLQKQSSLNFVGFLKEEPITVTMNGELQIPSVAKQLKAAADSGIKEVFVPAQPDQLNELTDLIQEGEKQGVHVTIISDSLL